MLREIFIWDSAWLKRGEDFHKKCLPEWWQRGNWMSQTIPWPHHSCFLVVWEEKIRCEHISQANKPETKHFWRTCVLGSSQIRYGKPCYGGLGHSWLQDQHSHCQGSKGEHSISAVSLVWHTNANYFNKPTKACEMGWSWPEDQALFPPLLLQ